MSNFETVKAVTENIRTTLKSEGINFLKKTFDDGKSIPASLMPFGEIIYTGEAFEGTLGGRPPYAEAGFNVKVRLSERDPEDMIREEQRWLHKVRSVLTAGALNAGELSGTKYVSKVSVLNVGAENLKNISTLSFDIKVRYREC